MGRSQHTGLGEELEASFGPEEDPQQITDLLVAGEYEQAASGLREKLAEVGEEDVRATSVMAAYQLCLTCSEYRQERSRQRQALNDMAEREAELRQQVLAIVAVLSAAEMAASPAYSHVTDPPQPSSPRARQRPSVWSRLRNRLAAASTRFSEFARKLLSEPVQERPSGEQKALEPAARAETERPAPSSMEATVAGEGNIATPSEKPATYRSYRTSILARWLGGQAKVRRGREKELGNQTDVRSPRVRRRPRRLAQLRSERAVPQPTERGTAATGPEAVEQAGMSTIGNIISPRSSTVTRETTVSPTPKEEVDWRTLAVYCLGSFAVYQNDNPITEWNGLKGLSILKYMIAQRGKPVAKEILMEVGWPESDPEAARRNLHQAIYSLRQTLRHSEPDFQHIQFHNDSYRFHPQLTLWIDFVDFEKYAAAGQALEAEGQLEQAARSYGIAAQLYRGDLFEEDLYEEWAVAQRERLRNLYLQVADRLIEHTIDRETYTVATALCQTVLAREPYHETAHRRLMECYMAQGQRHLAVRQYRLCAHLLEEELDLQPSEELEALYRRITASSG